MTPPAQSASNSWFPPAQRYETNIHSIAWLSEEAPIEATRAKRDLDALTEATGGRSYFPVKPSDLDGIAYQLNRDIHLSYTLGYTPSNAALDGTFREIKVVAEGPNKPVVRTRKGYQATVYGIKGLTSVPE